MARAIGYRINELLLLGVILIQVGDFLKLLSPFWDYVNKIINWVLIAVLFYMISPSDVFFGKKRGWWDLTVILAFFGLVLKNFLVFAATARDEMLRSVTSYVALLPDATAAAKSAANITVDGASYLTFTIFRQMERAGELILPYASQLTMSNSRIPVSVTDGVDATGAVIQPYGLDGMVLQLYNTLLLHQAAIERVGFLAAIACLILLGLYAASRFKVEEESLLNVIHDGGELKDARHRLIRILAVLLCLAAFFVILFNPVVEWLAMAVDAAFAMLGVTVVVYLLLRTRRRGETEDEEESAVDRIGGFGNTFFERFGKLFEQRRTVFLALAGLLILHLLVDVGSFILPYLTGLTDPLYFSQLGAEEHRTIWTLMTAGWSFSLEGVALVLLYLLNVIGIVGLLTLPAYLWYHAYHRVVEPNGKPYRLAPWAIALLITGAVVFLLAPAFKLVSARTATLVGVDLQTVAIATQNPLLVIGIALTLFAVSLAATLNSHARDRVTTALLLGALAFLCYYTILFLLAIVRYYGQETLTLLAQQTLPSLAIGLTLSVFFVLEILFYAAGFLGFIYEMLRE